MGGTLAIILTVVAGAEIHQRIAARIERARTLEGIAAHVDGVARAFAGVKVKEVNMAIHSGIYYFNKIGLILGGIVKVHYALGFFWPADDERLSRPAGACPCAGTVYLWHAAGVHYPCVGIVQRFFNYCSSAVGGIVAEIVAAEGDNTLKLGIIPALAKVYGLLPLIA